VILPKTVFCLLTDCAKLVLSNAKYFYVRYPFWLGRVPV
jgi:hypothetical protein